MKDFIIFTPSHVVLNNISLLFSGKEYFMSVDHAEIYISKKENKESFFKIRDIPSIIESYDSEELDFVYENISSSFNMYLCNYRSVEFAKHIINIIAKKISVVVDNDFDQLMTGEEFLRRTMQEPDWDWTR
ncbi:hypothetical protein EUZ85_17360 [Hahella sp. KA22]|uniref:hypothetical protein n=1 Tax=Hahella sp. KA22 TaxID=1628392 RepID=UPI000FDEB979|nr:hypothetical protein [Hahella sp. KA22]AZZ92395.1 hypothetical protein ENC22_14785 [Hahella sp. KA22]QAY55769.1 hypothetical protein EUZ85_17360 [Hahella sp. KA22]